MEGLGVIVGWGGEGLVGNGRGRKNRDERGMLKGRGGIESLWQTGFRTGLREKVRTAREGGGAATKKGQKGSKTQGRAGEGPPLYQKGTRGKKRELGGPGRFKKPAP